jgi:hypothetical protein
MLGLGKMEIDEMGLPKKIDIKAAWYGDDLRKTPDLWSHHLNSAEINELETAAANFLKSGEQIGEITKENFYLPTFGNFLAKLQDELKYGLGFKLIRGLPVDRYDARSYSTIFCGIGSHLGLARSQNAAGHLLGHVRDVGLDINDPSTRVYQTTARQHFHTDSCDVVGLLCLREAKEGGKSMLASSVTVFNEMSKRCPRLVRELFKSIARDRRGEIPDGQEAFYNIPVFNWLDDYLTCFYHREYIDSAQRYEKAPKLSSRQIEALNLFDQIANEESVYLGMQFKPGDMQFVYNHSLLHDRTEFIDWPDPAKRRHLLRLWLALPSDRPLPESFAQRYGSIEIGIRGGIETKETVLQVPLDA